MKSIPDTVKCYPQSVDDNISLINEAIINRDLEALALISHTLKGLSAQFGVTELSVLSKTLEKLAKKDKVIRVRNLLDELSIVQKRIEKNYAR